MMLDTVGKPIGDKTEVCLSVTVGSANPRVQARRALLEREIERWLPLLIAHERPDKIILFGSYPHGDIGEWSDVDMVIVREDEAPFLQRIRRVLALLQPRVGLDVLVYTPAEHARLAHARDFVRQEIVQKGAVICERVH